MQGQQTPRQERSVTPGTTVWDDHQASLPQQGPMTVHLLTHGALDRVTLKYRLELMQIVSTLLRYVNCWLLRSGVH